jgi:uncharacterized membrane protein YfcA
VCATLRLRLTYRPVGLHNDRGAARLSTYLICLLILILAAFAQTVSGFGFALAAVPLLSLIIEPTTAIVTATLGSTLLCATTAWTDRAHINRPALRTLTLSALAGMPGGLLLLHFLPSFWLRLLIAVVTLTSTILVWRGVKMSYTPAKVSLAGALSGVLLTSTGTNGPPLVASLQALGLTPRAFRATMAALFVTCGVVGLAGFTATGAITGQAVLLAGLGLVSAGLGGWAGHHVFMRINPARFRHVVLIALTTASLASLTNALT